MPNPPLTVPYFTCMREAWHSPRVSLSAMLMCLSSNPANKPRLLEFMSWCAQDAEEAISAGAVGAPIDPAYADHARAAVDDARKHVAVAEASAHMLEVVLHVDLLASVVRRALCCSYIVHPYAAMLSADAAVRERQVERLRLLFTAPAEGGK